MVGKVSCNFHFIEGMSIPWPDNLNYFYFLVFCFTFCFTIVGKMLLNEQDKLQQLTRFRLLLEVRCSQSFLCNTSVKHGRMGVFFGTLTGDMVESNVRYLSRILVFSTWTWKTQQTVTWIWLLDKSKAILKALCSVFFFFVKTFR